MPALSLALALALGQLPPPQLAQPGTSATLEARKAELDSGEHTLTAEGEVTLRTGGLSMRSDALEYDTELREGTASGSVVMVDGNLVITGRRARFSLLGEKPLTVESAELFQKLPGERPMLAQVQDPERAHTFGHNSLILRAVELRRLEARHLVAKSLQMSSCDCRGKAPAWSIRAASADLVLGDHALLYWPVFYVKNVPVLPLPVMYVPLTGRHTGFLLPRPGLSTGNGGFNIDEPFYLTLGPSWDLTLEAGYRFGRKPSANDRAGIKGARASAELRWAPTESTSGRLHVMAIDDRNHDIGLDGLPLPRRGWRGALHVYDRTDFGDAAALRAQVNLVTDRNLSADEPAPVIITDGGRPYTRSQALFDWRPPGALLGAAATYFQDLNAAQAPQFPETHLIGRNSPVTLQRPALVFFDVPRARLLGPLEGGFELNLARYQPFSLGAGPSPNELVSRMRAQATGSLAWSPFRDGPLRGEVYGWLRGEGSAYDGKDPALVPSSDARGRGAVGAFLATELSKVYGGVWRNTIAPRLEVRALTRHFGSGNVGSVAGCRTPEGAAPVSSVVPRDEYDLLPAQPCSLATKGPDGKPKKSNGVPDTITFPLAASDEPRVEGVASVTTRLLKKGAGEIARFEVGQGFDLRNREAADAFAKLELQVGRARFSAQGHYDWLLRRLASMGAQAGISDARGDSVNASYDWTLDTLDDQLRAGVDDLFGPRSIPAALRHLIGDQVGDLLLEPSDTFNLGVSVTVIKGVALRYQVTAHLGNFLFLQHTAGVSLGGACSDCWRLDLSITDQPSPRKSFNYIGYFHYSLELKNLGGFGG